MSTKAKRTEIQAPETLLWAASFEYKITLPIDECVDRLQIRFGSRASFVSTGHNTIRFSIRKSSRSNWAWATGNLELSEDDLTLVGVSVGIDPQIIILFLAPVGVSILTVLAFMQSIPAGLCGVGMVAIFLSLIYFGAKHERENLLLEFEETLE